MQSRNKIFDDLSQLMTNAMGVAQGARDEAETAMKSVMDRWLSDRDFVTREEFDAVRAVSPAERGFCPRSRDLSPPNMPSRACHRQLTVVFDGPNLHHMWYRIEDQPRPLEQ